MVDLDSDPAEADRHRRHRQAAADHARSLTTFSFANDVAKYFAIIPAMFAGVFPGLDALNVMRLTTDLGPLYMHVIFNALIIVALIPLLKEPAYRPMRVEALYDATCSSTGWSGVITPFIGIRLIDLLRLPSARHR